MMNVGRSATRRRLAPTTMGVLGLAGLALLPRDARRRSA